MQIRTTAIFLLTKDHKLALMDTGQVGRLDEESMHAFTDMLLALVEQETDRLVDAYLRLGSVDEDLDLRQLKKDAALFLEQYYDLPVEQISFGQALQDLLGISVKHHISLPSDFILLAKTFMGVEALARALNPKLNLIQAVQPKARAILWRQYEPSQMAKSLRGQFKDLWRFF